MKTTFHTVIVFITCFLSACCYAKGIIPDRVNQVIIYSDVADVEPVFYLIFSIETIASSIKYDELIKLLPENSSNKDMLAIRVYGKKETSKGRFDYFFGSKYDSDSPWNNGIDFRWEDWSNFSDDIWDNLAIGYEPQGQYGQPVHISNVVVRRGGQLLLDTRAKKTYLNEKKISFRVSGKDISPTSTANRPLLSLSRCMKDFKKKYYEIRSELLETAYQDLAQTDKTKYANRGNSWCSEFASYIYRKHGYDTPDPNEKDVYWKNLREYFSANGSVYTLREVAAWSDSVKKEIITPGSVVSIITGEDQTHTILFSNWVELEGQIDSFTGISGNNKGMVWAHAPVKLPPKDFSTGKTSAEIADYDEKCFIGVCDVKK